jgi:hypothetical protein
MKYKIFSLIIFIIIIFSCDKNYERKENIGKEIASTSFSFRGFKWDTSLDEIFSALGEPKYKYSIQQYGKEVTYYAFSDEVEYGYRIIPCFAFIDNKLVTGTYAIVGPFDEEIKNIKYHYQAYDDLQNKLTLLYGEQTTGSEILDDILPKNNTLPLNIENIPDDELISRSPYVSFWVDNDVQIKLTYEYVDEEDEWEVKIDFIGPAVLRLLDEMMVKMFSEMINDNKEN